MNDEVAGETTVCMVLTTMPDEAQAEALARQIVVAGLGACVQVQPIKSFYLWKDEACCTPEWRLSIKTLNVQYARLEEFIRARHSYETPEIVRVPIEAGSEDYLQWVAAGSAG